MHAHSIGHSSCFFWFFMFPLVNGRAAACSCPMQLASITVGHPNTTEFLAQIATQAGPGNAQISPTLPQRAALAAAPFASALRLTASSLAVRCLMYSRSTTPSHSPSSLACHAQCGPCKPRLERNTLRV